MGWVYIAIVGRIYFSIVGRVYITTVGRIYIAPVGKVCIEQDLYQQDLYCHSGQGLYWAGFISPQWAGFILPLWAGHSPKCGSLQGETNASDLRQAGRVDMLGPGCLKINKHNQLLIHHYLFCIHSPTSPSDQNIHIFTISTHIDTIPPPYYSYLR